MPTSHSTANANSHWLNRAKKRLLSEFRKISDDPSRNIRVNFKEDQFLEWHFLFKGLKETVFEGGEYHGMLKFPENYPFSPPSIQFFTPNGRFKTNERVCFILSDFHPECWKPGYTVSAMLQGAYSFMMSETTETVGSLIMDRNEIINLARMSKEFNRNSDTFNELFKDKVDEDIEYPLDNSDDLIRKKNIERPSDLIPIAVPNTTRLTQSISTNKANELLSHAKVDKEEHAIGQNSSFAANTSLDSFNCPSNSDEGKESHTPKLLERTLPERSKSTHGHNSATRVSQYPERPENVSVQSSDYVINNSHNNNRDTSDIPKPNREVSSERSNDLLSQNTSSDKSLKSSKEFSSKRSQPNLSHTIDEYSTHIPKGSEEVQMFKTGPASNSPTDRENNYPSQFLKDLACPTDAKLKDAVSSNTTKLKMSLPPNSSTAHQSSSMGDISSSYPPTSGKARLSQNTTRDDKSTHLYGRSETVLIPKTDLTNNSLTYNQSGIPSVVTTETMGGSMIIDGSGIRNLARKSKYSDRDSDTFNELLEEKVVEDIKYPLVNSDDACRRKNIERSSNLNQIPVPDATEPIQSISTHKANERPSREVDKVEHAIGQNSSYPPNTSRNSFNCPSSSDKGKGIHISKFLDSPLPEGAKSTNNHNSATWVSQDLERPENVSVRSSDYVINIATDKYDNRDTTFGVSKPNEEFSSERSNDSLRQNASSNRSMDSSKKSTTDKYSANPPKRSENAQMPKTGHRPNSLAQDQSGITSVASDSSKEFSLRKSQPNLSYTTDKYSSNLLKGSPNSSTAHQSSSMVYISPSYSPTSAQDSLSQNTIEDDRSTHLSGRSEIVSISKKDHTLNSFTYKKDGIPSIVTTETVGSLKMDRNGIRNLARKSKDSDRDNDTFNELFGEKIDEDINYYLNNSDGANRKWNIERPSHLNQIPVPNTTEPTQSISTHKANERPSHLAKVLLLHKDEQAIGQTSFLQGNASLNTFNCPSSSVIGKESHTSNLLERTLLERSKSTHSNNSATWVSQCPEKADNVSVRSSDYVINNAPDNYNRDIHDISKPNKEFSSEKSRGRLSKKASGNRSMNSSSFQSRTSLDKNTLPQTTGYDRSTHLSEESKNVSAHKANHTPSSLTDRENQILQDSNAHIDKDSTRSRVMDLNISNLPPSDYPSEPLHSQVQPKVSREKLFTMNSNITDSNELFKEKVDETIKCPLNNFPTEHKKRQSTIIGPDSHLKQSEIIASSSGKLGAHERLSTDSILSHPNNEKNIDSLNSNRVAVQDRSAGAQLYSIHKAKEQPSQHYKMPPLENAKHVQANLELRVQTISEKAKLSIKPLLNNISKTLINTVNASELNAETPAKNPFVNISDHSSKDITEKQSKTPESSRSSLVTSQRNQNTITDERALHQPHPPGTIKDDPMQNKYRSPKYFFGNQSGTISIASDSTNIFPQKSRLNQNKTADKCVAHPPGEFENVPRPKFDRAAKSLADKNPHSNYSSQVLSSLPSTIIQVHYGNPDTRQTFTTSSDRIIPRNTNSKLQDSAISNSTKEKAPQNTGIKKTDIFPRSSLLDSSVKSKYSKNLSVKSTNNRPPSHPPKSSNRNRSSQNTRGYNSMTNSLSLTSLNNSQGHENTNRLSVPPEKIEGNLRGKSDQAPLSSADNRCGIIFVTSDLSNEFSSQISPPNQTNTIDKKVANPSGRSENVSVSNYDRVHNYLAGNEGRIPTVPSNYLEKFSSQISLPHLSKTIDKRVAHPPGESENSRVHNFDQVSHSFYDKKNDSTSDFSQQLGCLPGVVVDSASDTNLDQFFPLIPISNAQPEKDYNLSRERNPFRSNTHSDNPLKVFHSTSSKVLPKVQYEDPFTTKTNITSSSNIPSGINVSLNTEHPNFDIPDYSIKNKSTPNLSVRRFIESHPSNPSNSSTKNGSSVITTNAKRTNEKNLPYLSNSSNTNKSLVNTSAKRINEKTPSHPQNIASQNTNGNEYIDKSQSHSITSLNRSQGHRWTKTYVLLPDGSSLTLRSNSYKDTSIKRTGPIKSDHIPSSATFRSHDDKLKLLPTPASRTISADNNVQGSRHTHPIRNSHYFSLSANNHNHDIFNQPEKSNNQSFNHKKFEFSRSFNSNIPSKEKFAIDMKASKYTTSNSQRYETHLRLLKAKSYSNSLLSRNDQRIKHLSLHGFGSEC